LLLTLYIDKSHISGSFVSQLPHTNDSMVRREHILIPWEYIYPQILHVLT